MRAAIFCFSGTGNTQRISEGLARELMRLGVTTDAFMIRSGLRPPSLERYDRIIIAYPVHAFNAPTPVLEFLRALPEGRRLVPVYLLRTSGEPLKFNEASGVLPKRILKRKGYFMRGELGYVMPYNIIFRHSEKMAVRMLRAAERKLAQDAKSVYSGKVCLNEVNLFRRAVSFALRIEHAAMPLIGRGFRVSRECTGCGLCERICPQGNIRMVNGRPQFGKSCVGCMGCAFHCPKDAVRTFLLNGWRVNGAYQFRGEPAQDFEICRYCRKSYQKYFHSVEDQDR